MRQQRADLCPRLDQCDRAMPSCGPCSSEKQPELTSAGSPRLIAARPQSEAPLPPAHGTSSLVLALETAFFLPPSLARPTSRRSSLDSLMWRLTSRLCPQILPASSPTILHQICIAATPTPIRVESSSALARPELGLRARRRPSRTRRMLLSTWRMVSLAVAWAGSRRSLLESSAGCRVDTGSGARPTLARNLASECHQWSSPKLSRPSLRLSDRTIRTQRRI